METNHRPEGFLIPEDFRAEGLPEDFVLPTVEDVEESLYKGRKQMERNLAGLKPKLMGGMESASKIIVGN